MKQWTWQGALAIASLTSCVAIAGDSALARQAHEAIPNWPATVSPLYATPLATDPLREAFENRRSNVQVQGVGAVTRILADDVRGSKHQRFILRLGSGQTVLIAHNIDLAPRIASLQVGDHVEFFGEYEWNAQGGVVHWTHRDPAGNHVAGWLRHGGRLYQ